MSGIAGILNLDGAPVDRVLLGRMTDFMQFRGPDERRIWIDRNVGFGHTLLRTTEESKRECQPCTLDGRIWIVADARVDARSDLIAELTARGEQVEQDATDVELLLRAYRTWDEDCVEHLLGDFAFAVWDAPKRRLFCARDHLGVKPFFYSRLGQTIIFSNTLDCIRQHPAVSDKLNDLAIADFLLFEVNQDLNTTSFAHIRRIPPAHRATWSAEALRISRYWTLPIDEPIYFKRADEYTDRFKELLDAAVRDRLRTNKIAILMSGGLDSPTLAATACSILRSRSADCEVRAFTTLIDRLDQNERHYASLVAEWLGIPIHFRDLSARMIDPEWDKAAVHTPEPVVDPTNLAGNRQLYRRISTHSRVLFYGEGPDNALAYEWKPYLLYLARMRRFGRIGADICRHMLRHKRIPLLPTIPRMLRAWSERDRWDLQFPSWFNQSFESRMGLRERWEQYQHHGNLMPRHPVRPDGYQSFYYPNWQALFNALSAGGTAAPIETRHPFLDMRLLRYMLAVPVIPWCRVKYLERRSMQGVLPASLLRRPKSPLTSDPIWETARSTGLRPLYAASTLFEYVDCDRVPNDPGTNIGAFSVNLRPRALNYWLKNLRRQPHNISKEDLENEFTTQTK